MVDIRGLIAIITLFEQVIQATVPVDNVVTASAKPIHPFMSKEL